MENKSDNEANNTKDHLEEEFFSDNSGTFDHFVKLEEIRNELKEKRDKRNTTIRINVPRILINIKASESYDYQEEEKISSGGDSDNIFVGNDDKIEI